MSIEIGDIKRQLIESDEKQKYKPKSALPDEDDRMLDNIYKLRHTPLLLSENDFEEMEYWIQCMTYRIIRERRKRNEK